MNVYEVRTGVERGEETDDSLLVEEKVNWEEWRLETEDGKGKGNCMTKVCPEVFFFSAADTQQPLPIP